MILVAILFIHYFRRRIYNSLRNQLYIIGGRMDRYLKEVGDRIRQARTKKGLSQAQLAEIIDKTPPYVSNIEMGKQNMSIIVLYKIVNALDISADWVLANDTPEAVAITLDSVTKELEDCTPEERRAIIQMIQNLKATLRSFSVSADDE